MSWLVLIDGLAGGCLLAWFHNSSWAIWIALYRPIQLAPCFWGHIYSIRESRPGVLTVVYRFSTTGKLGIVLLGNWRTSWRVNCSSGGAKVYMYITALALSNNLITGWHFTLGGIVYVFVCCRSLSFVSSPIEGILPFVLIRILKTSSLHETRAWIGRRGKERRGINEEEVGK